MKIYFTGAIAGGREDAPIYKQLIEILKKHGEVLTEHIGNSDLTPLGENLAAAEIHDRDLDWLKEADVLVAEVSTPSLGVGYEIGRAVEMGKKVLCLYRPQEGKRLSGMIAGCANLELNNYKTINEAIGYIDHFFSS